MVEIVVFSKNSSYYYNIQPYSTNKKISQAQFSRVDNEDCKACSNTEISFSMFSVSTRAPEKSRNRSVYQTRCFITIKSVKKPADFAAKKEKYA